MKGRQKFQFVKPIISMLAAIVRVTPAPAARFLWFSTRNLTGSVGALCRYLVAKRLARTVGDNVFIAANCVIRNWEQLEIGTNVSVHEYCYLNAAGGIKIGDNVSIAHGVSILSTEHTWNDISIPIKYNPIRYSPVEIADDVWVGCGVRLLAGCRIERRTILAAGAVVTAGKYGAGIYGGVPAKLIKRLS